jgi:hypothetical protein
MPTWALESEISPLISLATLLEAALSIVNSEYAAAWSGQESVEAAQANAEKQLARLRYLWRRRRACAGRRP